VGLIDYVRANAPEITAQLLDHLVIVAVSMLVASGIGITVGALAARRQRLSSAAIGVATFAITLPSFALFSYLVIYVGLGDLPTEIGLVAYAQLAIVRNTVVGLRGVDPAVLDAASGMGMTGRQRLLRVQLPLALPLIVGGVRQATVMVTAIATVGAAVGANDLGQQILGGLRDSNANAIFTGVVIVAAIGLAADQLLGLVQRLAGGGELAAA